MTPDILLIATAAAAGWLAHAAVSRRGLSRARQDPVTGLPTRAGWTRRATRILRRGSHVVVLVDLDRFKQVNDTYGHAAGDGVLAAAATRIRTWLDTVGGGACGRLGGDEFAIVSVRMVTVRELSALATILAAPVRLTEFGRIPMGASVGAAVCVKRRALSPAMAAADAAMYEAKRAGGGLRVAGQSPDLVEALARPARPHRRLGA